MGTFVNFGGAQSLQTPATATSQGAVTTGTQTFAGDKTFTGAVYHSTGTPFATSALAAAEVALNNGTADTPGVHFYTGANANIGIDVSSGTMRFVKNLDESGGTVLATLTNTGNMSLLSGTGGLTCGAISGGSLDVSGSAQADNLLTHSAATLTLRGAIADGASAVGLVLNNNTSLTTAGAKIASFRNANTEKAAVDKDGKLVLLSTDNSGTPGNTTINNPSGRAAIASGASACVVTNSTVTATSIVRVQLETSGAGVGGLVVVPAAGSFTVTSVSGTGVVTVTTAITKFSFVVFN